jgi:hypothetical protein
MQYGGGGTGSNWIVGHETTSSGTFDEVRLSFIEQCFFLDFMQYVSADASDPSSGLFQQLTYTTVRLKSMQLYVSVLGTMAHLHEPKHVA